MSAREVSILSLSGGRKTRRNDQVAEEEPLEIQIQGVPCAVVMRTPGDDEDLVTGFLATERIVAHAGDIASIRHCSTVQTPDAEDNVILVVLADGVAFDLERVRRNLFASSSCGVCGKATIEAALSLGPALTTELEVSPTAIYAMPAALRRAQSTFDATGGLHAAGLFSTSGEALLFREDVGRHNAVDKVVGAALRAKLDVSGALLLVSGRVSFEIVQKAVAAKIAVVAGISAPTSLAVRFAEALGVTVIGFLRGEAMNVYSHAARLARAPGEGW